MAIGEENPPTTAPWWEEGPSNPLVEDLPTTLALCEEGSGPPIPRGPDPRPVAPRQPLAGGPRRDPFGRF